LWTAGESLITSQSTFSRSWKIAQRDHLERKLPDGSKPVIDRDFVIARFPATFRLASRTTKKDEDVASRRKCQQQKSKED